MARILVISFSDLSADARVDRQIGFLREVHEVVAAGLARTGYEDVDFIDVSPQMGGRAMETARRGVSAGRLAMRRYREVYFAHPGTRQAIAKLEGHHADLIVANDLSALPLAVEIAAGAPVVFDAHELATAEFAHVRWWKMLMAPYLDALLRQYLPRVGAMITVAPILAQRYEATYGIPVTVITNAPLAADLEPTPVGSPIKAIHHGTADPQRGIDLMIEAADRAGVTLDLLLMPVNVRYFEKIKRMAAERPHVNLAPPLPQRDLVRHCNAYDVGLCTLPPVNENIKNSLPNKLFEFIQARLAVVVGPSPEMAAVVRGWKCGVVTDGFSSEEIASALREMTPERIASYKEHSHQAAGELNASRNREILLALIERVLGTSSPRFDALGSAAPQPTAP